MTSILMPLKNYTVFDLETTGFDPGKDEIVEIGAVRVRNGYIMDQFSSMVRPSRPIPEEVVTITGISDEDVAGAPSIEKILPEFLNFVGSDIVVGHNVKFDIGFIQAVAADFNPDFADTMRISRCIFPEEKHHKLANLKEWFGISTRAHRAMGDVLATQRAYISLIQLIAEKNLDETALLAGETKWAGLNPRKAHRPIEV